MYQPILPSSHALQRLRVQLKDEPLCVVGKNAANALCWADLSADSNGFIEYSKDCYASARFYAEHADKYKIAIHDEIEPNHSSIGQSLCQAKSQYPVF